MVGNQPVTKLSNNKLALIKTLTLSHIPHTVQQWETVDSLVRLTS